MRERVGGMRQHSVCVKVSESERIAIGEVLDPSAAILVLRIVSRRQSTQAEGGGGGLPIPESHSMAPALCSSESAGRHTTREFCGPRDETDARSMSDSTRE